MAGLVRSLAVLAVALSTAPAPAQEPPPKPLLQPEEVQAGLPLYSADGKLIGRVVATGVDEDNEPVLVAEIERPLGLGSAAVAIPGDMLVKRGDRIELTLTEAEVNARIGGNR